MSKTTETDLGIEQLAEPKQNSEQERQCQTWTGVYSPHEIMTFWQTITARALKHSGGQNCLKDVECGALFIRNASQQTWLG